MTAVELPDHERPLARPRRISAAWAAVAGILLVGSGALQVAASLQRWVGSRASLPPDDVSVEDHLYDYAYPADPWEPIGTAAQLFGLGYLLLAVGIVAMVAAVVPPRATAVPLLAIVPAASFAFDGAHALVSGLLATPSTLAYLYLFALLASALGFLCLTALAALWLRRSPAVSLACILLLGCTVPGYLFAAFVTAPAVTGYQSHDTTPYTESIVALSAVAAGAVMLVAAFWAAATGRRRRRALLPLID